LRGLCSKFQLRDYAPGEVIVRQGDVGHCFYIILHGSAAVFIKQEQDKNKKKRGKASSASTSNNNASSSDSKTSNAPAAAEEHGVQVNVMKSGVGFGELALLSNIRRTASIIARQHCVILSIDKKCYNEALKDLHQMKLAQRTDYLASNFFFSRWSRRKCVSFSYAMRKKTYSRGSTIYAQGDSVSSMFLVESGECHEQCLVDTKTGAPVNTLESNKPTNRSLGTNFSKAQASKAVALIDLASLRHGEIFGIKELISKQPTRTTTMVAATNAVIYEVQKNQFRSYFRGAILQMASELVACKDELHQKQIARVVCVDADTYYTITCCYVMLCFVLFSILCNFSPPFCYAFVRVFHKSLIYLSVY
jgi:CRP-like cAMP-binding protein